MDPKTGAIKFISYSDRVKNADDLVRLENQERAATLAKHGVLEGDLKERFDDLKDSDWVDVRVYLRFPEPDAMDPETHTISQVKEYERSIEALKPLVDAQAILAKFSGGLKNPALVDTGFFECRVSKRQLDLLRRDKAVGSVSFIPPPSQKTAYPFFSLATSAYNPPPGSSMPSVYMGQGVNAATIESGIANNTRGSDGNIYRYGNVVSCLGLTSYRVDGRQPPWTSSSPWTHSQETFKCLWQAAPYANLFHKSIGGFENYSSQNVTDFISVNSIQSISMSMSEGYYSGCTTVPMMYPTIYHTSDANGYQQMIMDEWAFRSPYPVISTPTGNWGVDYQVQWECYNAISVGNVRHTNLNHYEIPSESQLPMCSPREACTQTRNPPSIYGGALRRGPLSDPNGVVVYSGYSGDREMPYLVAPGITPSPGIAMDDSKPPTCLAGPLWCGTSYSAPTVNGIAACVMSADSRMVGRPHVVRAVLLATAENVDGTEWDPYVDGKDGAGVVSGFSAQDFAKKHKEPGPWNTAEIYAVSSVAFDHNIPNGSTYSFNVLIPNPMPPGKHLRVVLTWNSNPVRADNTNYLSDLDLSFGGDNKGPTRYSSSYNGNVEIVDIPQSELTPGRTDQAVVTLWANRTPASGLTSLGKYALAWNWVKDHAD